MTLRLCVGMLVVSVIGLSAAFSSDSGHFSVVDSLFAEGGLENYKHSIELCLQALEATPDDYEANWKCAKAYREYGEEAKRQNVAGWKDICEGYGKQGMKYAQRAISLRPESPEGYYYYGLSVGIYSDAVSILTALREGLKGKTQESLEKAYALDKTYDEARPILALGRFWAVLPWPLQDKQKALEYFREYQATGYIATNDQAKLFIAELLVKLRGKGNKTEANALLQQAAGSEEKYYRDWANRLLRETKWP